MTDHKTWPVSSQKELLRATFLSGDKSLSAFEMWKSQIDMADHPDFGSFRLLPFLFHHLKAQEIDDPVMMKLKGIARRNWYKNQQFFRSWAPQLQALHQADIECMLLSGPALTLNYYGDFALESEADLAILVPTEQARPAIKQLQTLGWRPMYHRPDALVEPHQVTKSRHVFQDAAGRRIHLHWHLLPACRTAEAEADFWSEAIVTKVHNVPVRILNPPDQILYSCVEDHLTVEPTDFLRAIDVMLMIQATPDLAWDRLLTQAEKYHLVMPLLEVMRYIQDTVDEPLPPSVWQRLRSLPISRQDRFEYSLKRSRLLWWRRFWEIWFDYRRHTSQSSFVRSLPGFPRYLQRAWPLPGPRQILRRVMSIVHRRLRRRFFYHQEVGH